MLEVSSQIVLGVAGCVISALTTGAVFSFRIGQKLKELMTRDEAEDMFVRKDVLHETLKTMSLRFDHVERQNEDLKSGQDRIHNVLAETRTVLLRNVDDRRLRERE